MITGPDTNADPASMPLGSVIAGRYQTSRLLGEGGFGAVFEALDRATGGRVALKIISASVLQMAGGHERFRREVDIVRRLSHPNIVRVVDAGLDTGGTLYIAFELLEGRSLEAELERRGSMQVRRVAAIAKQILSALETAHASGVIHRDLKPANVFLTGPTSDEAKLLDFGIAKSTNPNSAQGLTKHGMMLGTPAYMSPEQLFGKPLGPGADLFAFGIVMAEMLNGRSLYRDDVAPMSIIQERIQSGRVPIPDIVKQSPLAEVITKAVELDVVNRFQSAREMMTALERVEPLLVQQSFVTGRTPQALSAPPSAEPGGTTQMGTPSLTAMGGAEAQRRPEASDAQAGFTAVASAGGPLPFAAPPTSPSAWGPAPAPWVPPAPMVLRRKSNSGMVAAAVIVVALIALSAIAVGVVVLVRQSDRPRSKKVKRAVVTAQQDVPTARPDDPPKIETTPPPHRTPEPPPVATTPAPPGSSINVERGVARSCKGVATLTEAQLRRKLEASSLPVNGRMSYCAGDMINFRCMGPGGRGFTVDSGGGEDGSATLFKLGSPADAEAFARKEASGGPLTLVYDGSKVLRLELPRPTAERFLAGVCK